jgi:hypothetical protein
MRPLPAGAGVDAFDIAVKSHSSPLLPIGRVVGVGAKSGPQRAEEDMLPGIDHNSRVPLPDHQVSGLRTCHTLKFAGSDVQIRGRRITVGESGAIIDGVHQVGTIGFGADTDVGVQRSRDHRQSVIRGQSPSSLAGVA